MISRWSGAPADARNPLLFESHALLELTMPVNFDTLCRPSQDPECDYLPTVFEYRDAAGNHRSVRIGIRRRDGWRAQRTNCQVPTLFVRFPGEDTRGTPFEGQTELALTSHCGKGISPDNVPSATLPDDFERYAVNEYLGYRLYNLFTEVSLRVRLARITYANPDNPRRSITNDAFFAEHFESLARRVEAELLPARSVDPARLDTRAADQMALFHFMIGNTDWSIAEQENVIILQFPGGEHVPVLYDLDLSGLVNAHYARPAPGLPIESVRQRYYLGYCHPDTDWTALFAKFRALEGDIARMVLETPRLGRGDRRAVGAYLDSFYEILDSPEARQRRIVEACQPWPLM
jgi:hypothetical protein